jgi:hypothetical protein
MDQEGGSLSSIIGAFGYSDEFNRRYGGLSYTTLVTKISQLAPGRDPDRWVGLVRRGTGSGRRTCRPSR